MKPHLKFRRKLFLLSLPVVLMLGIALLLQRLTWVSGRLVGTWENSSVSGESARTTFKANGEYETELFDSSKRLDSLVFKGRYTDWGNTFRLYKTKRYIRTSGNDVLFVPCNDGLGCLSGHEASDMDQEMSKPKYFSTILSADWKAGVLKVRSPIVGQYGGVVSTWRRQ